MYSQYTQLIVLRWPHSAAATCMLSAASFVSIVRRTKSEMAASDGESGKRSKKLRPSSTHADSRGSIGMRPRNGTELAAASLSPPPLEKTFEHSYRRERASE